MFELTLLVSFELQQWFSRSSASQAAGVSYPAVRPVDVFDVEIPLPPLAEQGRIVVALEGDLSRLDFGIEAVKKSRERLRLWTNALLSQALQGSYHEADELPSGWEWSTVGDLADVGTGMTPLRSRQDYYADGIIPWVTSALVNKPFIGEVQQYVTEKAIEETSLKIWPKGTLVVAMYGEGKTRGRSSELLIDATMNQACAAIVLKSHYENRRPWVKLALEANYSRMRRLASGGAAKS
ncbi:restriction endonuclease subunit S [Streptosporangium lutulentum]